MQKAIRCFHTTKSPSRWFTSNLQAKDLHPSDIKFFFSRAGEEVATFKQKDKLYASSALCPYSTRFGRCTFENCQNVKMEPVNLDNNLVMKCSKHNVYWSLDDGSVLKNSVDWAIVAPRFLSAFETGVDHHGRITVNKKPNPRTDKFWPNMSK